MCEEIVEVDGVCLVGFLFSLVSYALIMLVGIVGFIAGIKKNRALANVYYCLIWILAIYDVSISIIFTYLIIDVLDELQNHPRSEETEFVTFIHRAAFTIEVVMLVFILVNIAACSVCVFFGYRFNLANTKLVIVIEEKEAFELSLELDTEGEALVNPRKDYGGLG